MGGPNLRRPAVRGLDHPPHQRGREAWDGVLEVRLHRQRREEIPRHDCLHRIRPLSSPDIYTPLVLTC